MIQSILTIAVLLTILIPGSLLSAVPASAQCSYAPGTPIQLVGTPHLFIADDQGMLHWGGDTRALAGHAINWGSQCAVNLDQLRAAPRGDPWLSAGLPKIGDPIYLAKWEDTQPAPTLLHIQSIADVELFGINTANYGNFVLDRDPWQQRFGFNVGSLRVGPLASAASFAWSDADRASYGQLLLNMENIESAALFGSSSAGVDPIIVLPRIANCERQGMDRFDLTRSAGAALQITQDCLSGLGAVGPVPTATATSQVPQRPTNVQLLPLSSGDLQVAWDPVPAAAGYRIYGGDQFSPPNTFVTTAPTGQTFIVISGRSPGLTYCYAVSAFNFVGESPPTVPVCTSTPDVGFPLPPPPPPGSTGTFQATLTISAPPNGQIVLQWLPNPSAQSYRIYETTINQPLNFSVAQTVPQPAGMLASTATVANLTAGQTYLLQVRAVDQTGLELVAPAAAFLVLAPGQVILPPPTALTVSNSTGTSITLTWNAVPGAMSYRVLEAMSPTGPFLPATSVGTTTGTSATVTGLAPNTVYSFQVIAVDANGNQSAPSNTVTASTGVVAPTSVAVVSTTSNTANLTWVASPNATSYRVMVGTSLSGPFTQATTMNNTTTGTTVTGLNPATPYFFQVVAVDANGVASAASSTVNGITTP